MGGRTAVGAALALWLGLLAAGSVACVVAAIVLCVPMAWLCSRLPGRLGGAALLAAIAAAGALRGAGHRAVLDRARAALDDERFVRIVARVTEPPLRESGEPVAMVRIESSEASLPRGARLRLRLPEGSDLEWGDRARLLVRLDLPRPAPNPGGFDPADAANAAALVASGRAFAAEREAGGGWLNGWPRATGARWRRAVEGRFATGLSHEARELVAPLVTGDRTAVSSELSASLRASGLVHLLALSGLHVVWLAAIARGIAAALGGGLGARAMAGACCALFYVVVAGPLPSLLRAAVTELVSAAARLGGRALDPLQSLALAAIALLIAAPGWGGDVGFQLSCAATLGLVGLSPRIAERLPGRRALHAAWTTTAGAQIAALPILIARFHAVSWPGLFANLVAVPVSSLLLAAAWLGALADLAAPGAGARFFSACEPLARLMRLIADLSARLPHAMAAAGAEPAIPWLAGLGAAGLVVGLERDRTVDSERMRTPPGRVLAAGLGGFAVTLAVLLAVTARPLAPPAGRWWLIALDVGQGDALALAFEDRWWLVDAGPRTPHHDAAESAVLPFFRWAGVRELDALIVTHADGDHAGGVPAVRRALHVRRVLAPPALPRVRGPAARFGATMVARGDTLRLTPSVVVQWPPRAGERGAEAIATDNRASLVLEVGSRAGRVLLTADVDSVVEAQWNVAGPIALLKVGHHGAASSSGARALAALAPRLAVISCGRRNPFGHPSPATLERLARQGVIVHRTDRSGMVAYECSESGVRRLGRGQIRQREVGAAAAFAARRRAPEP